MDLTRVQQIYGNAFSYIACQTLFILRCVFVSCFTLQACILSLSFVCIRSRHAKRACGPSIKDLWGHLRLTTPKVLQEARHCQYVGSESFFSLSLELQRSASKMACWCRYARASVFNRQQTYVFQILSSFGRASRTYNGAEMGTTDIQSPK